MGILLDWVEFVDFRIYLQIPWSHAFWPGLSASPTAVVGQKALFHGIKRSECPILLYRGVFRLFWTFFNNKNQVNLAKP